MMIALVVSIKASTCDNHHLPGFYIVTFLILNIVWIPKILGRYLLLRLTTPSETTILSLSNYAASEPTQSPCWKIRKKRDESSERTKLSKIQCPSVTIILVGVWMSKQISILHENINLVCSLPWYSYVDTRNDETALTIFVVRHNQHVSHGLNKLAICICTIWPCIDTSACCMTNIWTIKTKTRSIVPAFTNGSKKCDAVLSTWKDWAVSFFVSSMTPLSLTIGRVGCCGISSTAAFFSSSSLKARCTMLE